MHGVVYKVFLLWIPNENESVSSHVGVQSFPKLGFNFSFPLCYWQKYYMTSEGYSTALYVYNDQRKVKYLIFLKLSMKFVYHTICQGIRK